MSFTPKTRLEKILCGVAATAKTRLEKAVAIAIGNAGGGGGGSAALFEVAATLSENDQGKVVVTTDRTAEEWYNAAVSGATAHMSAIEPTLNAPIDMVLPFEIFRATIDGSVMYTVKARLDLNPVDALFMAQMLLGNETVVLTKV